MTLPTYFTGKRCYYFGILSGVPHIESVNSFFFSLTNEMMAADFCVLCLIPLLRHWAQSWLHADERKRKGSKRWWEEKEIIKILNDPASWVISKHHLIPIKIPLTSYLNKISLLDCIVDLKGVKKMELGKRKRAFLRDLQIYSYLTRENVIL